MSLASIEEKLKEVNIKLEQSAGNHNVLVGHRNGLLEALESLKSGCAIVDGVAEAIETVADEATVA